MTQTSNDDSNIGQRQGEASAERPVGPIGHAAVLQRIIAQSRKPAAPPLAPAAKEAAQQQSVERQIGTALGRTAEKLYALPVFIQDTVVAPASLAELPELLPEQALLAIVEGRGSAIGVVALSPGFVASLIEVQAIGRVSTREVRARKPTRTDASISADFVNMLLSELGKELANQGALPHFSAFGYASYLDDPRPLMLMLEDVSLTRVTLNLRVGAGGQRDGSIVIALPAPHQPVPHQPDPKSRPFETALLPGASLATRKSAASPDSAVPPDMSGAAPDPADDSLAAAMQHAPVQLVGILCRKKVSLGSLRNLVPGAMIQLPHGALDDARIETLQGQLLAQGRLGEADGYHAIRLRAASTQDQSGKVLRPRDLAPMADGQTGPGFPPVDTTQPDAFRDAPNNPMAAAASPFSATEGTAALDISQPQQDRDG